MFEFSKKKLKITLFLFIPLFFYSCGGGSSDSGGGESGTFASQTVSCGTVEGTVAVNTCPWPINIRYLKSYNINTNESEEPIVGLSVNQRHDMGKDNYDHPINSFNACKTPLIPTIAYRQIKNPVCVYP